MRCLLLAACVAAACACCVEPLVAANGECAFADALTADALEEWVNCADADVGAVCEGDGEFEGTNPCQTDNDLDNCAIFWDFYRKVECAVVAAPAPTATSADATVTPSNTDDTSAPPPPSAPPADGGLGGGWIALIVVLSLVLVGLIVVLIVFVLVPYARARRGAAPL
tara:strand:+ start:189 stop:692 length:504 start_codon:yes stop_codon:yes gene_type:complete